MSTEAINKHNATGKFPADFIETLYQEVSEWLNNLSQHDPLKCWDAIHSLILEAGPTASRGCFDVRKWLEHFAQHNPEEFCVTVRALEAYGFRESEKARQQRYVASGSDEEAVFQFFGWLMYLHRVRDNGEGPILNALTEPIEPKPGYIAGDRWKVSVIKDNQNLCIVRRIECTTKQAAAILGISVSTLNNRLGKRKKHKKKYTDADLGWVCRKKRTGATYDVRKVIKIALKEFNEERYRRRIGYAAAH